MAQAFPGNWFWGFLAYNQTHVDWAGCSLHDTIQPGFSFLVGVALPYSIASRLAKGGTFGKMFGHALWRSLLLVALGIFLRSMQPADLLHLRRHADADRLGLSVPVPARVPAAEVAVDRAGRHPDRLLAGMGALSRGGAGLQLAGGGRARGLEASLSGFAAHWNKNANFGNAFDQWFLNLFPRTKPFVYNEGGYLTLSFIPTLGTMILGLAAGRGCARRAADSRCGAC